MIRVLSLPETESTNSYVARNVSSLESGAVVTTDCQTAGRGQRGNSWESEHGKNLTFSMLIRPDNFPANRQFFLSEAVAVAIVDVLGEEVGIAAEIKWPNDIYHLDRKLAGILIEHAVMGCNLMHTIIGVGLNVNQQQFFSDAPNPVSIRQIIGHDMDRDALLEKICRRIDAYIHSLQEPDGMKQMHSKYMLKLWRNDGKIHKFRDTSTQELFMGKVEEVKPAGHIVITIPKTDNIDCDHRCYAFKEIEWII